jgi:hypothetical protein
VSSVLGDADAAGAELQDTGRVIVDDRPGTLRPCDAQFGSGETSKTFNVLLVNDVYVEGNETFSVALSNLSGNFVLGSPNSIVVTVNDDDSVTPTTNPADDAQFFVRQQYLDFLNREPDANGLSFWAGEISACGADPVCVSQRSLDVSSGFFSR